MPFSNTRNVIYVAILILTGVILIVFKTLLEVFCDNEAIYVPFIERISAKLACPMRLEKYPLDTQHCPMMFESCKLCVVQ